MSELRQIGRIIYKNGDDAKTIIVREQDDSYRYCVVMDNKGGNYIEYKTFDGLEKAMHDIGYKQLI